MVLHYKQHVSKLIALILLISTNLYSRDIPMSKTITLDIPLSEYSILEFPFEIKDMQFKVFTYQGKRIKKIEKSTQVKHLKSLKSLKSSTKPRIKKPSGNILGMEKGKNIITFRPKAKGFTEIIVWGNKNFPMMIKINVVSVNNSEKYFKFVELRKNKKVVRKFESDSHVNVIKKLTKHLYDDNYKSTPAGYENIFRTETYSVNVQDEKDNSISVLKASLLREIKGRNYLGQVWEITLDNYYEQIVLNGYEYDSANNINHHYYNDTVTYENKQYKYKLNELNQKVILKKIKIPENFKLSLYEELFDEQGIYGISLETYGITKEHGTRIMIVREN